MTPKYMIVRIKKPTYYTGNFENFESCFHPVLKGLDTPEYAIEIKDGYKNPDWYIVMPYYE